MNAKMYKRRINRNEKLEKGGDIVERCFAKFKRFLAPTDVNERIVEASMTFPRYSGSPRCVES